MPTKRLVVRPANKKSSLAMTSISIASHYDLLAGRCRAADYLGADRTRGPHKERQNLGIYRQQLIGKTN